MRAAAPCSDVLISPCVTFSKSRLPVALILPRDDIWRVYQIEETQLILSVILGGKFA
jgi:hypothetical protein